MGNSGTSTEEAVTFVTCDWIADQLKVHPAQARRIFKNIKGVINISRGKKNMTLRVPLSVYHAYIRSRSVVV